MKTVDIHRSFFEKITTLHREANRINGNYPFRYSRHFYDVFKLIQKGIGEECLSKINILQMDIRFKSKFYPCNWAKYDKVLEGNCRLICDEQGLYVFRKDFEQMKIMIYGECPSFDEIICTLKKYEEKINEAINIWRLEQ